MRQAILARDAKVGRQEVRMPADLVTTKPAVVQAIGDTVRTGSPSQAVKAALAVAAKTCAVCHRPLTHEDSLKRGMGPVCACSPQKSASTAVQERSAPLSARGSQEAYEQWMTAVLACVRPLAALVELSPETPPTRETCRRHLEEVVAAAVKRLTAEPPQDALPAPGAPASHRRPAPPRTSGTLTPRVRQAAKNLGRFTNATMAKRLDKDPGATFRVLTRLVSQGELHKEGVEYVVVPAISRAGSSKAAAHA